MLVPAAPSTAGPRCVLSRRPALAVVRSRGARAAGVRPGRGRRRRAFWGQRWRAEDVWTEANTALNWPSCVMVPMVQTQTQSSVTVQT